MRMVLAQQAFLELLSFYLQSTLVAFEEDLYTQRHGVCIGLCLAPILSDLFLVYYDKQLNRGLSGSSVQKVFILSMTFLFCLSVMPQQMAIL